MRVGMNYAWPYNLYGATFGPNPHVPLKRWRDERALSDRGQLGAIPAPLLDQLRRNLDNLRKMKLEVVRLFLLSNCFNYEGHGPYRRQTPPGPLPYHDWEFSPPLRADPRFAYHLERMLSVFREAGLQVIPSFVDFAMVGRSRGRDEKGLAPGGRADLVNDASKRQQFLSTMLNPLLSASNKYREQIYAWEVINEPYWCYSPIGPLSNADADAIKTAPDSFVGLARKPEVTFEQMNAFIGEAIELIHSKGFPSTVGHRFFRDLTDRKDLEWNGITPPASFLYYAGSRPQFHYYTKPAYSFGDPYQIKGEGLFNGSKLPPGPKPFLGEFDSDLNVFGKPWPELQGSDSTLNRLKLLAAEGCELALIWPDHGTADKDAKPDPLKLAAATRKALVQFTGGVEPPPDE